MLNPDFTPPEGLGIPLWRSLLLNFIDGVSPERLPPLELTSEPVDLGLMLGDLLSLPWYRTVFGNLSDVISPEVLPPLQLQSKPVDCGELLGDQLSHGWLDSLMGNLRDRLAPEKLAPLQLTSRPVPGFGAETSLQILDWSELLTTPKMFLPDAPAQPALAGTTEARPVQAVVLPPADPVLFAARSQLVRDLGRTRFRRRIWIGLALAEIAFLVVSIFR